MKSWFFGPALRVSLAYVLLAGLWILFSDNLLAHLATGEEQLTRLQSYKGWAFVAATGCGSYILLFRRGREEAKRQALAEIMQAAALTRGLQEFLELMRQSLAKVLDAENLFVVFHDSGTGLFEEVFSVDQYDPPMPPSSLEKSITSYVFRTGEPLLLTQAKFDELEAKGEVELVGANSASWLGAPLKTPAGTIGVIAVQNYEDPNRYSERDKAFLASVGAQVALTIERRQAEEKLEEERILLRTLIDSLPDRIYVKDQQGRKIVSNTADWQAAGGKSMEDVIGKTDLETYPLELAREYWALDQEVINSGTAVINREEQGLDPEGNPLWILTSKIPLRDAQGKVRGLVGVGRDITERKRVDEALRKNERVLREAEVLGHTGSWEQDLVTGEIFNTEENLRLFFGHDRSKGAPFEDYSQAVHPDDREFVLQRHEQLLTEAGPGDIEYRVVWPDGSVHVLFGLATVVRDESGRAIRVYGTNLDITDRKIAEARIERQVHRLSALRTVDMAISSSFDLQLSLDILLAQTINELRVDAAAVLVLNRVSNELEYAAGVGFRSGGIASLRQRPGEGFAAEALLERRTVIIQNLPEASQSSSRLIVDENFVACVALPLVAKGLVKGVMEVFHRNRLHPDPEWLDFLETLAGQAAIAIDSAQTFDELQRSNIELSLAYDATIEGWSRAMDLRDKETEGHTQRVTELALTLGRAMRLPEQELIHIRRGALLHDIGKMGVPDGILLKPGPLTEEEWVIMKKHPSFAYEMLAQVRYLEPALNIPYCHHENWDGSGYPRGLKGEQIPLSARIFAVVDVFDALTSDRPYRLGWSAEKAREYIREQAGKHFDPQIVELFLKDGSGNK